MTSRLILFTILVQLSLASCGQLKNNRNIFGEEFAKKRLEQSLNDKTLHNVIENGKEIISDSTTATRIAETILFTVYGQANIEKQRPYEIYKIKNYWSIAGTLPSNMLGGTFLFIMDARDGKIIRISHGK